MSFLRYICEHGLVDTVKSKLVLGLDDVLVLLTYLWAREMYAFPTECHEHAERVKYGQM
jgi:hypothetical protein